MSKDAFQDFTGQSVKPSVGMGVSMKPATNKMASVPVRLFGPLLLAQNARTVITEQQRANLVVAVVTMASVTRTTDIVLVDVLKVMAESFVTVVKATGNSDTQDGATIVGPIVGSVLGAALLIGLFILLAALIIRKRRSREVPSSGETNGRRTEVQFSPDNAVQSVDTDGNKPETSDPDSNYARLENYENPDDIRPYSMLQTDHGHSANISIQGDKEAVLFHNTRTTGDKTRILE
ncbi:hypothetical protein BaRGS_00038656 [Batillaria attramentaria]|uniref:Uncharacterized protein n=1 Tax=Batillaria attramentaria TaxID=370345 RepID=A0ABD0J521_9CAEN